MIRSAERMVLYRGPLSSCNYGCTYCPFAKHTETRDELALDREALQRFVRWACAPRQLDTRPLSVLFTPWGEALVRSWYQEAIATLSHSDRIAKVCAQTNLSCRLDWIERCNVESLALWCTFHPTETTIERFLKKCSQLLEKRTRFSVGIVATHEHYELALELRRKLPDSVYVWANAFRREDGYYSATQIAQWQALDPLFALNLREYQSLNEECHAGSDAITIDGKGDVRRCHFDPTVLSNIAMDERDFERSLQPTPCTMPTCRCHIGYVHLEPLKLYDVFRGGILERIPHLWPENAPSVSTRPLDVAAKHPHRLVVLR